MNKILTIIVVALCFLLILMHLAEIVGIQSQIYLFLSGEHHVSYFIKPMTEWFEEDEDEIPDTVPGM